MTDADEENLPLDLEVILPGFFRPEFSADNRQEAEKIRVENSSYSDKTRYDDDAPTLKIRNARTHQDRPLTEDGAASLFHEKGFCLFPHQTKVKRWNENHLKGMILGSDISKVYAPELESIIRNYLLPEYHVVSVDCPPAVLYFAVVHRVRMNSMALEFTKTMG